MPDLKLIAFDENDLAVLSANLQDAVLRVSDMIFERRAQRFAAVANRFDWQGAVKEKQGAGTFERRRCGLRFERVQDVKFTNLDLGDKEAVLSLLSIEYQPANPPQGFVVLRFSGGGVIRLEVECIEAELRDLGAAWKTSLKPAHPDADRERNG